jgi:hypothetical protein
MESQCGFLNNVLNSYLENQGRTHWRNIGTSACEVLPSLRGFAILGVGSELSSGFSGYFCGHRSLGLEKSRLLNISLSGSLLGDQGMVSLGIPFFVEVDTFGSVPFLLANQFSWLLNKVIWSQVRSFFVLW